MIDNTNYKLGKLAPRIDSRTLLMAKYTQELPPAPKFEIWTAVPQDTYPDPWPMFANDRLGDCVPAAAGHQIAAWTANAGNPFMPEECDILKAYEDIGGYVPGQPWTDQGCFMLDALNYWRKTGIAKHKIGAFVALDLQNKIDGPTHRIVEIMQAVWLFGGAYIGLGLPITARCQDIWTVPDGGPDAGGNNAPWSWGGHCVPVVEYSRTGVKVITWGRELWASWHFIYQYCDEAYGILSPDWISTAGTSPNGFDLATLAKDLDAITG
jgi:hypothetical protein